MKCLSCGIETIGATGRAGIFWPMLCQSCKDKADEELDQRVRHIAKIVDFNSEFWKQFRTKQEIADDEEMEEK